MARNCSEPCEACQNTFEPISYLLLACYKELIVLFSFFLALDTEVTSWGGVIVTPGPKAYEKQQDQEDEEVEGEADDEPEDSSEMPSQEQTEEKMETNQET